jgi:integrase
MGVPTAIKLLCIAVQLGRTKTGVADEDRRVLLIGRSADALLNWLARAKITTGAVFRGIDRWGTLESPALSPQAVNLILKKRARLAGLDAVEFSAHGLRSGYLTETARRGIPLVEAMQQSQHRSVQQAASYYNEVERQLGRAARVI